MDWTTIIITILTLLISNGGLVTLVTLREKKNAAFLDNISKLIDQWQEVVNDRKLRADELESDLDCKDAKSTPSMPKSLNCVVSWITLEPPKRWQEC